MITSVCRPVLMIMCCLNMQQIGYAQHCPTAWKEAGFNGKVRSMTTRKFKAVTEGNKTVKGEPKVWGNYKVLFRKDGTYQSRMELDENGEETDRKAYVYDASMCLKETIVMTMDSTVKRRWKRTYDERGNTNELLQFNAIGELVSKTISIYNEQNKEVERLDYDFSKKEEETTSYGEYDFWGYAEKEKGLVSRTMLTWDTDLDRVIRTDVKSYIGKDDRSPVSKYNERGQLIESKMYFNDELYCTTTYVNDKNGMKIMATHDYNHTWKDYTERFEYDYDRKGNWTLKVEYRNDQAKYITERTIVYF